MSLVDPPLTRLASQILEKALDDAARCGLEKAGTAQLFYTIWRSAPVDAILSGFTDDQRYKLLCRVVYAGRAVPGQDPEEWEARDQRPSAVPSRHLEDVLQEAATLARSLEHHHVGVAHLIECLLLSPRTGYPDCDAGLKIDSIDGIAKNYYSQDPNLKDDEVM
jgi:hypothetical protein